MPLRIRTHNRKPRRTEGLDDDLMNVDSIPFIEENICN